jgi:hypothetical protein
MHPAQRAREEKEAHPERYCPAKNCLWKTAMLTKDRKGYVTPGGYCPRHYEITSNLSQR